MGFTTKSFRFDNDNPVLKNFVDKQSNFSSAMKYLILYYCSTHPEIEDLSEKYKAVTSYAVMEQIRKNEGTTKPEATIADAPAAASEAAAPATSPKASNPPAAASTTLDETTAVVKNFAEYM